MADRQNIVPGQTGMKRHFANRARRFAKWARELKLVPALPLVALAIAVVCTLGGAFGPSAMEPLQRLVFWTVMMGWSAAKWVAWFSWRVKSQKDWWPAALVGTVVLNLLLPFELFLALELVGSGLPPQPLAVYRIALLLAAVILAMMVWRYPPLTRETEQTTGMLVRNGSHPARVTAVSAEDHYCRVFEDGGTQHLMLARFGDIVDELADQDGTQIHRGAWVADRAVVSARRAGRGWEVVLPCETALRVSATYRAEARRRGWLNRQRAPA